MLSWFTDGLGIGSRQILRTMAYKKKNNVIDLEKVYGEKKYIYIHQANMCLCGAR